MKRAARGKQIFVMLKILCDLEQQNLLLVNQLIAQSNDGPQTTQETAAASTTIKF